MAVSDDLIGYVAGTLTTISFVPQAVRAFRAQNVEAISLVGIIVFVCGVTLWFAYGLVLRNLPMALSNGITLVLALAILVRRLLARHP